jgi:predicted ferric reductase
MTQHTTFHDDDVVPLQSVLVMLFSAVAGALLAANLLPALVPGFLTSVSGEAPQAFWFLSRSSAFVAYLLLWLSMVFGLVITNRMARLWPGGPAAFELHQHTSLLAIAFSLFHALILIGDQYIQANLLGILLPFGLASYRPFWVGFGQLALYLSLLVTLTFYARKHIGGQRWKGIHLLSYGAFLLVMAHGLFSGTDTLTLGALVMYAVTALSALFLTIYRVLSAVYGSMEKVGA